MTRRFKALSANALVLSEMASSIICLAGCHFSQPLTAQEAEGKHLYEVHSAHPHEDNDLDPTCPNQFFCSL